MVAVAVVVDKANKKKNYKSINGEVCSRLAEALLRLRISWCLERCCMDLGEQIELSCQVPYRRNVVGCRAGVACTP